MTQATEIGYSECSLKKLNTVERQLHPLSPAVYLNKLDSFEWLLYRAIDRKQGWLPKSFILKKTHCTLTYLRILWSWIEVQG